jgi:hypothetical protein
MQGEEMNDLVQRLHTAGREVPTSGGLLHEAADHIEMLEKVIAEWIDKTEWVQKSSDWQELGMHRADALKQRIEQLERENAELRKDADRYRWLATYFVSDSTEHDDAIVSASTFGTDALNAAIDAAMKEQA